MPLTAKLSKPRLCNDNGFFNLWIQDRPFSLDSVQHLPKFVLSNFFQTVCDDKPGYDHIQLSFDSRTFFDLEWGGWLFVSCCIPFGWKSSSYIATPPALLPRTIYVPLASLHPYRLTTDIAVSSLSRTTAFQLLIKIFPQMKALIWLWPKRQFLSNALLFPPLVISLVWRNLPCKHVLGLFLTLKIRLLFYYLAKGIFFLSFSNEPFSLKPQTGLLYKIWVENVFRWLCLFPERGFIQTKSILLSLVRCVPFVRSRYRCPAGALRQELEHWLLLETWKAFLPWRSVKHSHVRLFSDSSSFAWGGVLSLDAIIINICDYWEPHIIGADLATKDTPALNNVLHSLGNNVRNSWVDAFVDSQVFASFLEQAQLPFPFLSYRS